MARSLGVSLAEAYPQVAAMWLQERNGGLTPQKATPKMQVAVWWRCAAGHEWEETISTRTTLPKWKNGDVAACRECVGYRVSYTYPDCGHTVKVTPESAAKKRGRCWDCQSRWWQENEPRLKKELSAAAKAAAGRAGKLLDTVVLPADMPAPLAAEWRWWAAKHLQGAIAAEEKMGKEGRTDEVLASVTEMAARLTPTKEKAGRAAATDGVLRILNQAHWAEGWLHVLTGRGPRPVAEQDLQDIALILADYLQRWTDDAAAQVAQNRADGYGPPSTPQITKALTGAVLDFARTVLGPNCRAYRELRLPLVPDGKGRYGRADVVICSPLSPGLVIELDSRPNPASAQKLAFARDAGAFPLWVRFGEGGIDKTDGVMVLDLREAVRGVCDAQPSAGAS
ncbi:zinc-ribbon domain-containing protein [Streptomyces sp. NPDC006879]|uniref:zinc-ribbon domain-containing protein n=1 Tax=Streptomyces sp. NPDC006879 TaxID=3364767 RepID=UPI0036AE9A9C